MSDDKYDVLVVGGGPVGLTLGCELLRHGVRCRLIDDKAEPHVWSKAAAVSARTLEVWRDMGIVDRALEKGRPVYGVNLFRGTERLAHVSIDMPSTPYPFILGLSQRVTENMLAERFVELGGELEREVKLERFEQDDASVDATLKHVDGREETIRVPWLVGCDGAKSTVRGILDLPFEGSTFEQTVVQADIRVQLPVDVDPHEGAMFLSDDGPTGVIPVFDEGRSRLIILGVPDPPREPPLSFIEELVEKRLPEGSKLSDPQWIVSFRFHGRVVPDYRQGRVFLAGDAAHVHSPAGGQGMNLGIQDAYNLAWKLALVCRGVGSERLLGSYSIERRPVGLRTVETTDAATKRAIRMMTLRSPIAKALRDQAASFLINIDLLQQRAMYNIGQLGVSYAGSPIVGEQHTSLWRSEIGGDHGDERPTITDWYSFTRGPAAGERVGDIDLDDERTLFDLIGGTEHVLLLFDGAADTAEGYNNLSAIAEAVTRSYGAHVQVHVVTPTEQRPEALPWDGSVLLDPKSVLHAHFGCGSEALYLIRPDGHVAFRTQPADQEALLSYLDTIFLR